MYRVFIADDTEPIRALWRFFLEEDREMLVVGEAENGNEAIDGVIATRPDVLLLDIFMPDRNGLDVIPVLHDACPQTAIIVASSFAGARVAPRAMELGAVAYFEKGRSADMMRRLVRAVCEAHANVA